MTEQRFKPATRPLNKRERRERMLDQYEDSLYRPHQARARKRKRQSAAQQGDVTHATNGDAVTTSKQRRQARRAAAMAHSRQQ